jgi:hypothetical protein
VFPDIDILLLGIGGHRNFLTHSAAGPAVGSWLAAWVEQHACVHRAIEYLSPLAGGFSVGFSVGVGSHLMIDGTFQGSKAVLFPLIGSLVGGTLLDDDIWLLANAAGCFAIAAADARTHFPDQYRSLRQWWEHLRRGHGGPGASAQKAVPLRRPFRLLISPAGGTA